MTAKERMRQRQGFPVEVHDHFDGQAHCVQCKGACQLKGAALALTEMIRWEFELLAAQGRAGPWGMKRYTMEQIGLDIDAFMERARETHRRIKGISESN